MSIEKLNMPNEICTKRLVLVRRQFKYNVQLYKLISENKNFLRKYLTWVDYENTEDKIKKSTTKMEQAWDKGQQYSYLITNKKDTVLGAIDIANIDFEHYLVEIGYWLVQKNIGNGYITEALTELENILFKKSIKQIKLECDSSNKSSINVALRCGYTLTETYRENDLTINIYLKSNF